MKGHLVKFEFLLLKVDGSALGLCAPLTCNLILVFINILLQYSFDALMIFVG